VVEQVELDVAPAAVLLELPLAVRVWRVLAPADNREVALQERVAGVPDEREPPVRLAGLVVKEDAPDPAGLAAVRQVEVLVARATGPRRPLRGSTSPRGTGRPRRPPPTRRKYGPGARGSNRRRPRAVRGGSCEDSGVGPGRSRYHIPYANPDGRSRPRTPGAC